MMPIDRSITPAISLPPSLQLPQTETIILNNGLRVVLLQAGEQEVVKADFAFEAGKWFEEKNLLAEITGRMLREGTMQHTANQIAEQFEFYGCNLESGVSYTHSNFQLYSLSKHLEQALPLLMELFTQASFPQHELDTLLANRKQKLQQRLAKNEFVANRAFVQALWGPQHPYGRITQQTDFDALQTADMKAFYQNFYQPHRAFVVLSGKFNAAQVDYFYKIFGDTGWTGHSPKTDFHFEPQPATEKIIHTEKKDAVQTAIQIGYRTINKYHNDYDNLSVLNTLFGGYFSSRLMANIREDKGYTYGIYSALSSFQHGGQFEITAEVGKEVAASTMKEIEKEIKRLHTELVPDEELMTVKNYMAGKILRSIDGPMKYSEVLKSLLQYHREPEYLNHYLQTIEQITSENLMQLAQTYLNWEQMYKVSVG
ncbi:MAG: pitrilysin family protein [Chitinophagales bacterium]